MTPSAAQHTIPRGYECCPHHLAFSARIERAEEDVQRLYQKQDKILWATLSAAGASLLTLIGMIASVLIH